MSTIYSGGKIAVVKSRYGIEVTTYMNELDTVLGMLSNGSLGAGTYGDQDHVAALVIVQSKIDEILKDIEAEAYAEEQQLLKTGAEWT